MCGRLKQNWNKIVSFQFSHDASGLSAKLHYTDTSYGHVVKHHQRTSSQQFYNLLYNKFATSHCQSNVKMLECGKFLSVGGQFVVQQVVELLWARPLVVSVGGAVQHVRSRCPCSSGVWHLVWPIQHHLELCNRYIDSCLRSTACVTLSFWGSAPYWSLAASGPAWNTLPPNIRRISNRETFCHHLKTYLFTKLTM